MADALAGHGNAATAWTPGGAVQTLGGRRSGGIKEPAVTAAGRATMRSAITSQDSRASEIGASKGWKHLTRQLPISGQTFCGQSGDDFIGFWQGISPLASAIDMSWETAVCVPAIAKA